MHALIFHYCNTNVINLIAAFFSNSTVLCRYSCFSNCNTFILGKLDSLEGSFISNSDSGLDDMDTTTPNALTNGSLPLSDAVAKKVINPEIKSWRFIEEEAPLLEFINAGAVTEKTELCIGADSMVPVSVT